MKCKMNEYMEPPVKIGDVLKLGITKFGRDGDPIIIHKKYVIFLKDTEKKGIQLNELIKIKIMKVFPKFAFAEKIN